jgi:hypothetical protein
MTAPVERKVQASSYTAAICGLGLWALGRYVFKGTVPDVLVSWTYVLVPGILTFFAGYLTHHTHRPDLAEPVLPPDTVITPVGPVAPADPPPPLGGPKH